MVKNQWFQQEWVQPGLKIPGSTWAQHATTAYAFIFCCSIWLTLTQKARHGFCRGSVWRGLADGVLPRCRSSSHSWGEVFGSKFVKFTNLQIFRDFAQFRGTIFSKNRPCSEADVKPQVGVKGCLQQRRAATIYFGSRRALTRLLTWIFSANATIYLLISIHPSDLNFTSASFRLVGLAGGLARLKHPAEPTGCTS